MPRWADHKDRMLYSDLKYFVYTVSVLATTTLHIPASAAKLRDIFDRHGVTIVTVLLLAVLACLLAEWTWQFLQPKEVIIPPSVNSKIDVNATTERIVGVHLFGVAGERRRDE